MPQYDYPVKAVPVYRLRKRLGELPSWDDDNWVDVEPLAQVIVGPYDEETADCDITVTIQIAMNGDTLTTVGRLEGHKAILLRLSGMLTNDGRMQILPLVHIDWQSAGEWDTCQYDLTVVTTYEDCGRTEQLLTHARVADDVFYTLSFNRMLEDEAERLRQRDLKQIEVHKGLLEEFIRALEEDLPSKKSSYVNRAEVQEMFSNAIAREREELAKYCEYTVDGGVVTITKSFV